MYRILISNILKTNHTQINIQPHSHFLHRSTIFSLSIYCAKNPFPGLQSHTSRGGRTTSLRSRQGSITRVEWEIRIRVCHSGVLPRAAAQCPVPSGGALLAQHPQGPPTPCHFESIRPNVLCISLVSFKFYPFPLLIFTFYHLNYTDGIMQPDHTPSSPLTVLLPE